MYGAVGSSLENFIPTLDEVTENWKKVRRSGSRLIIPNYQPMNGLPINTFTSGDMPTLILIIKSSVGVESKRS